MLSTTQKFLVNLLVLGLLLYVPTLGIWCGFRPCRAERENTAFSELAQEKMLSTVYIEAPGQWSGSGVVVGDRLIITARHVVLGAEHLIVKDSLGKTHEVLTAYTNPDCDFGLLIATGEFPGVSVIGDSSSLVPGQDVMIIGSPMGNEFFNTVTRGTVTGLNRKLFELCKCGVFTTDSAAYPGNSGGPVFDMQGKVVGILVAGIGSDFTLGVPINVIKDFLDELQVLEYAR